MNPIPALPAPMHLSHQLVNQHGRQVEQRAAPQRVRHRREELPLGQQRQVREVVDAVRHEAQQERVASRPPRPNDEVVQPENQEHVGYNRAEQVDGHGRALHRRNLARKMALNHAQIREINGHKCQRRRQHLVLLHQFNYGLIRAGYALCADKKYIFKNAFKACAPYSFTCNEATPTPTPIPMTSEKANTLRYNAARLSVPDELHWYNNHTNWDALSRKEFREIMIRMETITVDFYNDFGDYTYGSRCNRTAIKQFWADEWGCEYLPESGKWINLATNTIIKSETEKKAERDAKKAAKALTKSSTKSLTKSEKKALKASLNASTNPQYNDEEEEVYVQLAQAHAQAQAQAQAQTQKAQKSLEDQVKQQNQQKHLEQQKQQQTYDAWFDAEEEAYAEAYAQARAQEEQKAQAQAQKEQREAQAYLDSFDYTSEEEATTTTTTTATTTTRICCQAVLYIEELTETNGDPDWRAYIYYDARIRRYVLKGTRRSLRATSKKTVFPEIKLCFRSSRELAQYLCSSTDMEMNLGMYAMSSATVKDATFAELYALPVHGHKTELFGYDETRPRFSTFVNYLRMVRDIDATHSTFASF